MTTITFIGDIHGKVNAIEKALDLPGKKIFVGDFIDSWRIPPWDHDKCFSLVLDAMEAAQDVQCIYGNHELSYLNPHHTCSGYKQEHFQIMMKYKERIQKHFKPYILLEKDFLVSHAGLSKQIWDNEGLTLDSLPQALAKWWPNNDSPMHWIGSARGGWKPCGGMFWCDFDHEFQPIPGLTQVFGHTRGQGIRHKDNAICIDGLDKTLEFLTLEVEA